MTPPIDLEAFSALPRTHSQWYVSDINHRQECVRFRPYIHQLPLGADPFSLRIPPRTVLLNWNEDKNKFTLNPGENYHTRTIEANQRVIQSEFDYLISELQDDIHRAQFKELGVGRDTIPSKTSHNLFEEFSRFYNMLNASSEQLRCVSGIGEAREQQLLSPETSCWSHPEWVALTHCPNCREEFWSPAPVHDISNEKPKPSLEHLANLTYCPQCKFNNFTPAYLMEIVEFTNETSSRHATGTHRNASQP